MSVTNFRNASLDILAAVAGYAVSVEAPPAPVASAVKIFAQEEQPEGFSGLWIASSEATGTVYVQTSFSALGSGTAWQLAAALPENRHAAAAGAVGADVYILAGYTGSNSSTAGTHQRYNTLTGTTSAVAAYSVSIAAHAAVIGTGVYVTPYDSTSPFCRYSAESNTWSALSSLPAQTGQMAPTADSDCVYVTGGGNGHTATYRYDPVTGLWLSLASLPAAKYSAATAHAGGKVYVMGGDRNNVSMAYGLNIRTNVWSAISSGPASSGVGNGCAAAIGGDVYFAANQASYGYQPSTDTWSSLGASNVNHSHCGLAAVGQQLYLFFNCNPATGDRVESYNTNPLSDYNSGDVVILSSASPTDFQIADNCRVMISGVWLISGSSAVPVNSYIGDGTAWNAFTTA